VEWCDSEELSIINIPRTRERLGSAGAHLQFMDGMAWMRIEADPPVRLRPEPLDLCDQFLFLVTRHFEKKIWGVEI
jgi:hypothetical protein